MLLSERYMRTVLKDRKTKLPSLYCKYTLLMYLCIFSFLQYKNHQKKHKQSPILHTGPLFGRVFVRVLCSGSWLGCLPSPRTPSAADAPTGCRRGRPRKLACWRWSPAGPGLPPRPCGWPAWEGRRITSAHPPAGRAHSPFFFLNFEQSAGELSSPPLDSKPAMLVSDGKSRTLRP